MAPQVSKPMLKPSLGASGGLQVVVVNDVVPRQDQFMLPPPVPLSALNLSASSSMTGCSDKCADLLLPDDGLEVSDGVFDDAAGDVLDGNGEVEVDAEFGTEMFGSFKVDKNSKTPYTDATQCKKQAKHVKRPMNGE